MSCKKTSQLGIYLGITVFLAFAIKTGLTIMCWECNSEYDRRCGDPFNNHSFVQTDCSQRSLVLNEYAIDKAVVCRKITQKVKGEERFIRACGFIEDDKTECFRRAGTFDVQIEYCQCRHDGCNSATSVSEYVILTILASLILISKNIYFKV